MIKRWCSDIGFVVLVALLVILIVGMLLAAYFNDGTYLAVAIGIAIVVLMAG